MVRCEKCFNEYDETICAGVCPHCGYYEGCEQEDPRALPIGTVLYQRYIVGGVLGVGGFGMTYKVWDLKHNICKAVKEYFQQGVVNRIPGTKAVFVTAPRRQEEFDYGKHRLLEEARIVAKFKSSSIVRVDDFFEENNTTYMVMEFLDWQTLEEHLIEQNCPLSPEEAVEIGSEICEALQEIHQAGVIHRDISPDNIFIHKDGRVKIIDFGSARLSKDDTDDKMIMIKPGFAPPEQYERINPDHDMQGAWTDVYALGATLYLALTGNIPAEASDRKADFHNNTDRVCYPRELRKELPEYLSNSIMTAMAINIHERFQNAKEFEEALKQERKVEPVEKVRKRKQNRRRAGIGGGLLAAMVLLLISGYQILKQREEVVLDPADIIIWYSVNDQNEQKKSGAVEEIILELGESNVFSRVHMESRAISEDEYEKTLEQAYQSGNMPTVFECINSDGVYMEDAWNLKEVVSAANKSGETDCYFLENYNQYFSDADQLPTGFHIPVIYINAFVVQDYSTDTEITCMDDLMKLCNGEMKYKPMALNGEVKQAYEQMFEDFSSYEALLTQENGKEMFLEEDAALYFSDTSDYLEIQETLPGKYAMVSLKCEPIICRFSECFSISNCPENELAAAEEFLKFLLSKNAQDKYYLQNANTGLPINKAIAGDYVDVRRKFDILLNDCSSYTFDKQ